MDKKKRIYCGMDICPILIEAESPILVGSPQEEIIVPATISVSSYIEAEPDGFTVSFD